MTRGSWIGLVVGITLLVGFIFAAVSLAGARGKISILETQLTSSQDSTKVAVDSLRVEQAQSDALIAAQDSAQAADTEAVNAVAVISDSTSSETSMAIEVAMELAAEYPVIRDALILAQTALVASEEARLVERSTSAAAILSGQQRERTLGAQLLSEREASSEVIAGLNTSLSLAVERGDIAVRALSPSFFQKIFDMPEVAIAGAVVGGLLVFVAVN